MKNSPSPGSASGFVIAAFIFMWIVGFYPLLASVAAIYSTVASIVLLLVLPLIMALVLYPLWRQQERSEASPETKA